MAKPPFISVAAPLMKVLSESRSCTLHCMRASPEEASLTEPDIFDGDDLTFTDVCAYVQVQHMHIIITLNMFFITLDFLHSIYAFKDTHTAGRFIAEMKIYS